MNKHWIIANALLLFLRLNVSGQMPAIGTVGQPADIVITPYKTTMIADGKDVAVIKIGVADKQGHELNTGTTLIHFKVTGDARIISITNGNDAVHAPDEMPQEAMFNGHIKLILQAGKNRGIVKFDATAEGLTTGSTEIHTIQPGTAHPVKTVPAVTNMNQLNDKIIGADISFLPQLEDRGMKFYDKDGKQADVFKLMKDYGFNYVRLRIFDHPNQPKGYSPNKGYCDLPHTMAMAKRIKAAGLKFLLDFHYSDTWADPQRQDIPAAWSALDYKTMVDSVYTYTKMVMQSLKDQGTAPQMVQVGNEINHGMLWPMGAINNLDSLATLIYAGERGVKEVSPNTILMLHIALGGQNEEARFFIDNMMKRKVPFDVIGLSYYPRWHGSPDDLKANMADLAKRYNKYIMVAEYSQLKTEVNNIAFTAPGNKALGSFIWEPLSTWESFFDRSGKLNVQMMEVYPPFAKKYGVK